MTRESVGALTKLKQPIKFHWKCPKCKVPFKGELTHAVLPQLTEEVEAFERTFGVECSRHVCQS